MGFSPDNKIDEYRDKEILVQEYEVSVLEEASDLGVVSFHLPYAADPHKLAPEAHIFGNEDFAGASFWNQENYFEKIVFGIETEEHDERLKNGEYQEVSVKPFLQGPEPGDFKKKYTIPLDSNRRFEIGVERFEQNRNDENFIIKALNGEKQVFSMNFARTEEDWDFIARE